MTQPRWVVFGAGGMLGRDLLDVLRAAGHAHLGLTHADADVTDAAALAARITVGDIVVNCAAWTRVDDAEANREAAFALNATAPLLLARACADAGATLVQISTDYVFGDAPVGTPIALDAPMHPRGVYGESKALGEQHVRAVLGEDALIARVAWLYGAHGRNFVHTIRERLRAGTALRVVDDQVGQPTWTHDVAQALVQIVSSSDAAPSTPHRFGTYHLTSDGQCSWYGLACAIAELTGHDAALITPVPTSEYPTPALRPAWSVLAHDERVPSLPHWRESLSRYLGDAAAN